MRVTVNGLSLRPTPTGVGQYTRQLFSAMRALATAPEITFFYGLGWSQAMAEARAPALDSAWRLGRGVPGVRALRRGVWQTRFGIGARRGGFDLYHEPNFFPFRTRLPTVITVHDVSPLRLPQTHLGASVRYFRRQLPDAVRRAQAILVDSEFVRDELLDYFPAASDKLTTVLLGVDARFHPRTPDACASVLAQYGLTFGRYFLAVGTLEPRKNLIVAVRAYSRLPESLRTHMPLVIAGAKGWLNVELEQALGQLASRDQVRVLGYVPQASLPALHAGAALFLYPSIYEGFGLPPLEAMASGVPVIASNRASLPEVVGNAGRLLEPADVDAWTQAMQALVEDRAQAAGLSEAGRVRAARFTWERCAHETLQVYQCVLANEGRGG